MKSLTKLKILSGVIVSLVLFSSATVENAYWWDLNVIGTNPCKNGGTYHPIEHRWLSHGIMLPNGSIFMESDPDLRYGWCVCPEQWTGYNCSIAVQETFPSEGPCLNGVWIWQVDSPKSTSDGFCYCDEGWKGEACDVEK